MRSCLSPSYLCCAVIALLRPASEEPTDEHATREPCGNRRHRARTQAQQPPRELFLNFAAIRRRVIDMGKWLVGDWNPEKGAERVPTLLHIENEELPCRHAFLHGLIVRGEHVQGVLPLGEAATERALPDDVVDKAKPLAHPGGRESG